MSENQSAIVAGYEVTRDGRVFSMTNWRGYGKRELAQTPNTDGYPSVRVTLAGKRTRYAVHKLVAFAHLPPKPTPTHEVRHLDGDKLNPHADNLAWGTRKENAEDRERHGRTSRGATHSVFIMASNQAAGTRAFRRAQKESGYAILANWTLLLEAANDAANEGRCDCMPQELLSGHRIGCWKPALAAAIVAVTREAK